jgi:endonuclease G
MNKFQKLTVIFSLLTSTSVLAGDFGRCNNLFPNSNVPQVPQRNVRELCFDDFAVEYNVDSKEPVYSVERLSYLTLRGEKMKRTNHFHEEPMLRESERSTLKDYARSGYDRGHMAPAADRKNEVSMENSFSLSNMTMQRPVLNRKLWAKIEKDTRQYALKRAKGDVFVFTGPVFNANHETVGPDRVWVPAYFYKLVVDQATGRSWAFWEENDNNAQMNPLITYDELVRRTGIHFLKQ